MSMTKRDFQGLAEIFKGAKQPVPRMHDERGKGKVEMWNNLFYDIVQFCKTQNPRFDEQTFREWVEG